MRIDSQLTQNSTLLAMFHDLIPSKRFCPNGDQIVLRSVGTLFCSKLTKHEGQTVIALRFGDLQKYSRCSGSFGKWESFCCA